MRTREHASKIENSPGTMCETVPQATSWQIQEVDVGWDVYCRESKGFILQSKSAHFLKIRRRTTRGEITFHFVSSA